MKKLKNYATPLTSLVFLVIAFSGVMLYFKIYESYVKELHEVLGLVFVAVAILHIIANWTLMKKYFTKGAFIFCAILVVCVSSIFVVEAQSKSSINPKMYIIKKVINMPFDKAINVLDIDKSNALNIMKKKSIKIDTKKSIELIAKENKTSPFKILSYMLK